MTEVLFAVTRLLVEILPSAEHYINEAVTVSVSNLPVTLPMLPLPVIYW